ncbi:MAG TPA: prepilin-type N-terminal cleavage/methylation domain-containing protein [Syntrophobacteraceae bacterium]|nr:prepilin-type N-terminal cleavage/methylation domain-containing protein [Syntrophobacteraceae bacterium]
MRSRSGFTLLELIIATAISALVIGILSVCFSFTMRLWQVTQNQQPDQTFMLADLLKRQLAECDPTPVKFSDNSMHSLFSAQLNSIVFATSHSVKAISQGLPVVARYSYDPESRMLSYSETLLDPYHPQAIERFIAGRSPGGKETEVRSYGIYFPEFALLYAGKQSKEFSQSWESGDELPVEILLRWRGTDMVIHAMMCMVNAPFTLEVSRVPAPAAGAGGIIR